MIKRLQSSLSKLIVPLGFFSLMATAPNLAASAELRARSISELLKSHVLGERVQLEGRFVGQINYETVVFEDATGQIEVLVGEDDLIPSRLIDPAFCLRLKGEVGSGYRAAPLIHFHSVDVLSGDHAVVLPSIETVPKTTSNNENAGAKAKTLNRSLDNPKIDLSGLTTVTEILNKSTPGNQVTLYGYFIKEINYETLLFRDSSGEIEVVFAGDDFQPTNWSQPTQLTGEVYRDFRGNVNLRFGGLERMSRRISTGMPSLELSRQDIVLQSISDVTNPCRSGRSVDTAGRLLLFVQHGFFVIQDEKNAVLVDSRQIDRLPSLAVGRQVLVGGTTSCVQFGDKREKQTVINAQHVSQIPE